MKYKELIDFASFFHQDFGLFFENFEIGANEYLASKNKQQKRELAKEIAQLLNENPGKDNKGLKNSWRRLGGQYWSKKETYTMLKKLSSK